MPAVQVVLFDLDGTLVDSAPDLAGAVNEQRSRRGLPVLPYDVLRPVAGSGARGMIGRAFGLAPGDAGYEALRDEFHEIYSQRLLALTAPFERVAGMLDELETRGLPWGVVTNKAVRMASPILDAMGWSDRARVLVGGDTTPHTKPHPAPLLEAAARLGAAPARCVYVGDDPRDMRAGRAAGMATLAAAWGYLGEDEPLHAWAHDHVLEDPEALLNWLDLA